MNARRPPAPRLRRVTRLSLWTCLGLFACCLRGLAQTPPDAIEAIDVAASAHASHAVELTIRLKNPVTTSPRHFFIVNPPRIVLDFPGTANATGATIQHTAQGVLRHVAIAQAGDRSRLVLHLKHAAPYRIATTASAIVVSIGPSHSAAARDAAAHLPLPLAQRPTIGSIDFRRGTQGEGRIIVGLPDPATGPPASLHVRRQGKRLLVDFSHTTLPEHLARQLDATDFGTPVRAIRSWQEGADAHMVIEADGDWDYNAFQQDAQLAIEVRRTDGERDTTPQAARHYLGDKLSLDFQNVDVRVILQVLTEFTGLNIIASDAVGGAMTLRLLNVPWDQALDIVMQARGLDMQRHGNVVRIATRDELLTQQKLDLEQRTLIADLEPLRAEVFQLNYQKAEVFRKAFGINGDGNANRKHAVLSRRGSAVVDARTNQLFVTDTAAVLDNIRLLLAKVDIAAKQVLIAARIVEADDAFSRSLGVRLGFSARTSGLAVGSSANSGADPAGLTSAAAAITAHPSHQAVNLPARSIDGAHAGSFALSLFNAAANRFLNLELSALEADGKGKIISSPRVVTADQQAALIEQGEEIPYQQATSSGATSTAFKKANLKLEVTPQITPDGNVILSVDISKDSRGTSTPGGLAINTKHIKTLVQVENGGTVVIGGIYTQTDSQVATKVPLLGDLPILGHLFKSTARIDNKTELLIFLTPHIVAEHGAVR